MRKSHLLPHNKTCWPYPSGLVKEFVTPEILPWSKVSENYGSFLRQTDEFKQDKLWEDLRLRVIEHVRLNHYWDHIYIMLTYIGRISASRPNTSPGFVWHVWQSSLVYKPRRRLKKSSQDWSIPALSGPKLTVLLVSSTSEASEVRKMSWTTGVLICRSYLVSWKRLGWAWMLHRLHNPA